MCSKNGVTNVKKPTNPHKLIIIGKPPSIAEICLINIGCAQIPPMLVLNEIIYKENLSLRTSFIHNLTLALTLTPLICGVSNP